MSVFQSNEQRDLLLTLLKVLGGRRVLVEFDGSGDSGSIEDAFLQDENGNSIDLTNATFDWYEKSSGFDKEQSKWVITSKPVPNMPVGEILRVICEDALEDAGHDWYNNEGGYGSLTIDLTTTPPVIKLNVSIRVVSTEDYEHYLMEDEEENE